MLELDRVTHRYGRQAVLHDVSLVLRPGLTALLGPNGSGKSTLLKVAAGLIRPGRGRVLLQGRPIQAWSSWERGRLLAYVAQDGPLPEGMTVEQAVMLGRLPHLGLFGVESAEDRARARMAMEQAGVADLAARPMQTLSGGERQRVAIARALCTGARILLLDEPTSHLDLNHQAQVAAVLKEQASRGATVLLVVHDPNLTALADRVVLLAAGRTVAEGEPADVLVPAVLMKLYGRAIRVVETASGERAVLPIAADDRTTSSKPPFG